MMNVWFDGANGVYRRAFDPVEALKLLSIEEVKKILDYDMILLPENKTLAKKLEALGLTVVTL